MTANCTSYCFKHKNRKYDCHLVIVDYNGEIVYVSDITAVTKDCLDAVIENLMDYWGEKISAERNNSAE